MVKIEFNVKDPKTFHRLIQHISLLGSEANLKFNIDNNVLQIIEMDPANVCLINLKVGRQILEAASDKPLVAGVNLVQINRLLKSGKGTSKFTLKVDTTCSPGKMIVNIEQNNGLNMTREIQIENEGFEAEAKCPNLGFRAEIRVKAEHLFAAVREAEKVGESAIFKTGSESLIVEGKGDNASSRTVIPAIGTAVSENLAKARYSVEYLKKALGVEINPWNPLVTEILVRFSDDYPISIRYEGPGFSLEFLIAPRIECD